MSDEIIITEPQTDKEFEAYFLLRYNVLRKPWNQPPGSEKDEQEETSIHIMAKRNDEVIGVCRLQFNSPAEAQLRFMGVREDIQGLGIGRKLIDYAEKKAKDKGAEKMILQARDIAVDFYRKCGYLVDKKTFLMWNEIQHFLMTKDL